MNVGGTGPAPILLPPQVLNPLVASTEAIAMVVAAHPQLGSSTVEREVAESAAPASGRPAADEPTPPTPAAPVPPERTVDVYT